MTGSFKSRLRATAAVLCAAAVLAACGSGGYQRGIFTGYVIGVDAEQIESKIGKPDQVDTSIPNETRWVYNKKTFDPDNMNQVDDKTIVVLKKDAAGKLIGAEVLYL
jgi:hypothetical protein